MAPVATATPIQAVQPTQQTPPIAQQTPPTQQTTPMAAAERRAVDQAETTTGPDEMSHRDDETGE